MAASDEYPRGATVSVQAAIGAVTQLILPASPGIAHVVTDITGFVIGNAGAAAGGFTAIVVDNILTIGYIPFQGVNTSPSLSWTGKWTGAPGNAVTIGFGLGVAAYSEHLVVAFYDL